MKPKHLAAVSIVAAFLIGALIGRPALESTWPWSDGGRGTKTSRSTTRAARPTSSTAPDYSATRSAVAEAPRALVARGSADADPVSTPAAAPAVPPPARATAFNPRTAGSTTPATRRPRRSATANAGPAPSEVALPTIALDLAGLPAAEYRAPSSSSASLSTWDGEVVAGEPVPLVAPPDAPRTAVVGLPSLQPAWPHWFTPTLDVQTRGETSSGLFGGAASAMLNRTRVGGTISATPWAKATVVMQDARQTGEASWLQSNPLDVFEAFGEVASRTGRAGVRVGRQRIEFGSERLVGDSDWTLLSRSMDGVRGWWGSERVSVQAFAAQVVQVDTAAADPWWSDRRVAAVSLDVRGARDAHAFTPYALVSQRESSAGRRYTFGALTERALSDSLRVETELAWQRGQDAGRSVRAFAGHYGLTWQDPAALGRATIRAEYDHATGDRDAADDRVETFDPIAPDTGERFGLMDVVQLSNLRHVGVHLSFEPSRRTDVGVSFHRLFSDRVTDAVIGPGGVVAEASLDESGSRDIGTAVDIRTQWRASRRAVLHFGLATFFGGTLTATTAGGDRAWRPYAGWRVRF